MSRLTSVRTTSSKWVIVALRFAILSALMLYLALTLRPEGEGLGAGLRQLGLPFWILFGVYLSANIVYAIEAIEAFVSQRIAAGIFIIDVVLVCAMAFLSGEVSPEFFLSYFLTILVAATSGRLMFALGGSLVSSAVFALMATRASGSFESVVEGRLLPFVTLAVSTGFLVAILAGGTRRQLGQKQGVARALALSRRLVALFDLSRSSTSTEQVLAEFARDLGRSVFLADECEIYMIEGETLRAADGSRTPVEISSAPRDSSVELLDAATLQGVQGLRSAIRAPVRFLDTAYGWLWIARSDPAIPDLNENDRELAASLGRHVAVALHNADLLREIESSQAAVETTLSELRATQQKLLVTERFSAVGEVVSRVAHELNAPLTSILGTAELLAEQQQGGQTTRGIEVILKQVGRCRALVASLVKAVGRHKGNRIPVDLGELVVDVVSREESRLAEATIALEYDLASGLPQLMMDRGQISRIITHVIDNAIQAMERNTGVVRKLSVRTWLDGDMVKLSFSDTGPGINLDHLMNVFQPFYRGDQGTAPVGQTHSGLGLSAAHQAMGDHGGRVSATTQGDGGTAVTLEFPIPQVVAHKGKGMTERRVLARILVVDADPAVADLVVGALAGKADVHAAASVAEAEAILEREQKIDAAIADLSPRTGVSAQELHETLVGCTDRLRGRILWTSDTSIPADADEFITRSGGAFLAKPFDLRDLRAAVGALIDRELRGRSSESVSK